MSVKMNTEFKFWPSLLTYKPDWEALTVFIYSYCQDQEWEYEAKALRYLIEEKRWPVSGTIQDAHLVPSWDWWEKDFDRTDYTPLQHQLGCLDKVWFREEGVHYNLFTEHTSLVDALLWFIKRYHELVSEGEL